MLCVQGGHGSADARAAREQTAAKDVEGPLQFTQNASGDDFKIVCRENVLDQERQTRRHPGAQRSPPGAAQARSRPATAAQQSIARGVTETVVDFLEVVEVKIEHAAAMVRIAQAPAESEVDAVKKQRPVG